MKCRAVLGLALAAVIEAGCGNVRMPEPPLDLADVGLVGERVCGGRGAHRKNDPCASLGGQNTPMTTQVL